MQANKLQILHKKKSNVEEIKAKEQKSRLNVINPSMARENQFLVGSVGDLEP